MFNEEKETIKKGKRARSFESHLRSCTLCGSANGVEISTFHRRNDAVACQNCGSEYLIQSLKPLLLESIEFEDMQDCWWEEED